ncbi:hypothetical protein Pr1d_10400 [Bythopirellula goksoeyrii]|uniref:Uncharacterized protein n=1 Tax=Bythopirellula goksoeyrii TaxID=1400387 RepID=A0A5B9Q7Q4_9BACT|nr:hypothetical protein Pr1d_10400 [Bythopirellula goksoeyrii]
MISVGRRPEQSRSSYPVPSLFLPRQLKSHNRADLINKGTSKRLGAFVVTRSSVRSKDNYSVRELGQWYYPN